MKNPYKLKGGAPITDLRFDAKRLGQKMDLAIASNGELNAHNKPELIEAITNLVEAASQGKIEIDSTADRHSSTSVDLRRRVVAAINNDSTGTRLAQAGVSLAAEIDETAAREGLLRNILQEDTLKQGQFPRTRVKKLDVVAVVAHSAAELAPQFVREKNIFPPEFYIDANLEIENLDIHQSTGDLLEEKYVEGLQAIMVQEDRLLFEAADISAGFPNPLLYMTGGLDLTYFSQLRNTVLGWGVPAGMAVISYDLWTDIITDADFAGAFDPVSKYEIILTGQLGTILGLPIRTDGYRPAELRVLNPGRMYVFSSKEYLGTYTNRGGVESTPITGALRGRPTKGWYLTEVFSMLLANTRSVAIGVKS